VRYTRILAALILAGALPGCGGSSSPSNSPTAPTTPTTPTGPPTLTKPLADSPADAAQLDNVRPTLTVVNGTSNQTAAAKTYEFQISDNSTFSASANVNMWFATTVSSTPVPEDPSGKTKYALTQDLQPTTKYYWRARLVQSGTNSDWSDTRTFKTKLVGYNKPGALYDPLVFGETVGKVTGNVTWLPSQGIRMNDALAYVLYELPQVYSSGEMSVEVTGLSPDGDCPKARIFSMLDRLGVMSSSAKYSFNVQYRGTGGAPANCIVWKTVLGDNSNSVEPYPNRYTQVYNLDPSKVYLWQAFWTPTSFELIVKEGGATGTVLYDQKAVADGPSNWSPSSMYAFIGTNNAYYGAREDGTRVGMIVRNLWVGSTPRPTTLGSAFSALR
jgi:hypothetical protein